jgi:hypothetical protein
MAENSKTAEERPMNEICEDGSPQSKFTLYLLLEWGEALNEEMAVMIGEKAQEIYGAGAAAGGERA